MEIINNFLNLPNHFFMEKRKFLIYLLFFVLIIPIVTYFVLVNKNKKSTGDLNNFSTLKKSNTLNIYYEVPYIYDAKAVLKARYLNLTEYEPLEFVKCVENLKNCKNNNMLITAYLYIKADDKFCKNLNDTIIINGKIYKIENFNDLRDVCNVFYKLKTKTLEKKDCINPTVVPICDYYFSTEKTDFIKSNLEFYSLLSNPEKIKNCLDLEEPAAYYCLKIRNISCYKYEDPKEINKCMELLVIPDQNYREFLNKIEELVKNKNWKKIKEIILNINDSKKLHALARLGALNLEICEAFFNKSKKEYRYCLKRYYNQNFICSLSPDKRQCEFFDVLLNNKSCNLLKDPQHITDCLLFKKYLDKKDCNFFYTVGSDEYLGYLCALKTKRCNDEAYYDKMYEINCKYLTGQI
jgi:hypothetical protein